MVPPEAHGTRALGLGVYLIGETIRVWALHALGEQYSSHIIRQREHRLVQAGFYARIRHPFYLGQTLAEPAVALLFRSPLVLVMAIASIPFVPARIRRAAEMLLEQSGCAGAAC